MARLFTSSFLSNSLTAGVDFDTISNPSSQLSIDTSVVYTGTYSLKANVSGSVSSYVEKSFGNTTVCFFRYYFRVTSSSQSGNGQKIFQILDSSNNLFAYWVVNNNSIGFFSPLGSSNFSGWVAGQQYRLECKIDSTTIGATSLTAFIDGVQLSSFATENLTGNTAPNKIRIGSVGSNNATVAYFDDIAVNDNSGSTQNSYPSTYPAVTTQSVSSITSTTATFNGTITDSHPSSTARGVQYGTTPNVDKSVDESGTFSIGSYTEPLTSLIPNTTYYVRAYATNSTGTDYGSWTSFTTLASTYSITINGVNRTTDILIDTLTIEDAINDKQTNCSFQLIDRQSLGVPTTDQEVVITLDGGTKIFGGYTIKVAKQNVRGSMVILQVNCVDYTRLLDRNLVNTTYQSQTDQYIIQNIVSNYCQGSGITTMNVQLGVTINQIAFNYIQGSKALRVLSDLTGRNWYIDYDKDLHYFPLTQNPAPFNISDSQLYSAGQGYFNIQLTSDASQIKNRVYVRGGTKLSDATTFSRKGDGTTKKFNLPDKPHNVSVAVNGAAKTLGIKNIDTSGFDFYLNYEEKYLEEDAGGSVLSTTDVLSVNYTYDIPILVSVDNTASIVASGAHEHIIVDTSITTTQAARDRASAELTDYANSIVEGSFQTYTNGFRSGQYVTVNSTILGITSTNYIIQKVIAHSIGGGNFVYTIYLASAKTMGIIRFLLEMLENNKNIVQVATNEVLDNLLTLNDSLDPNSLTDLLTIDSAGPYRTWCKDSLESTITRARWGLFEWR